MPRIQYTREQLLNFRAQAPKEKPAGLPKELCISQYGGIGTIFNGRTGNSCRPIDKIGFEDDANLGSPPVMCI